MENEKEIVLSVSGFTATLKTSLTYGEHQSIQAVLINGSKNGVNQKTKEMITEFDPAASIEWGWKKLLTLTKSIIDKEGNNLPVSKETIEALPMQDGESLSEEIEAILENIKKK